MMLMSVQRIHDIGKDRSSSERPGTLEVLKADTRQIVLMDLLSHAVLFDHLCQLRALARII